jgi:hypothetical protein
MGKWRAEGGGTALSTGTRVGAPLSERDVRPEPSSLENGSSRTASGLEVIVIQLVSKEMAGHSRAMAVRLKYEAFAVRQNGHPGFVLISEKR